MKLNYDNLTPAQKAKWTRGYNKIDDARCAAFKIQWETYNKKSTALRNETEAQVQQIRDEATAKIEELYEQIKQIKSQSAEQVATIYGDIREACAPEFLEFSKAQEIARKWGNEKWEEFKAEFWKELGYTAEEVTV
jgi:hypothetical protein